MFEPMETQREMEKGTEVMGCRPGRARPGC